MDSQFEKELISGAFKNSKEFINNSDNLKNIIKYLNNTKITVEVLDLVFALLKFFRFPLALCCSQLYAHILQTSLEDQNSFKDRLLELAAYVKSLVNQLGCPKIFPEIQYFFKWGHAKKKFKINILPQEKKFFELIMQLSKQKTQLQSLIKSQLSLEQKRQKVNNFLSKTLADVNVFQQKSIEYMKSSCSDIIMQIEKQQDIPKDTKNKSKPISIENIAKQNKVEAPSKFVSNQPKLFVGIVKRQQQPQQQMKHICCRRFFNIQQRIQYPQSLRIQYKFYNFPFVNNSGQFPGKEQKIKRTICGFLNAEGGIIYFGIKQLSESRERIVSGLFLTQNRKRQFTRQIMRLSKQVLPDVGKKITVKYVPIKNSNSTYINGRYVVKVIIDRGAKNQVYSYVHQFHDNYQVQKFTFRTQNQVLQISQIQRILKILKNKLESPQRQFYPTHSNPCPEPQVGKPVYDKQGAQLDYDDYQYEKQKKQVPQPKVQKKEYEKIEPIYQKSGGGKKSEPIEQYQSDINQQIQKYEKASTWKQQQQQLKKIKYMQRQSGQVLINLSIEQLQIFLVRMGISYKMSINIQQKNWSYLQFDKAVDLNKLKQAGLKQKIIPVYSRISYKNLDKDQILLMQEIIAEYRNKWSTIKRQTSDKILIFKSGKPACKFYLRMVQMGLNVTFTQLI